jgi:L-fuconolactonase
MRIDSHQHFWRFNAQRDSWITDEMSILRRDFLPDELFREMRANGIDRCIAVQADQSEAETNFLLSFADQYPQIAGVVGWVNLCDERVGDRLAAVSKFPKLRGLRNIVQVEPDDRFLLREDFLRGVGRLTSFGFTYDILIYPRHLPVAEEFVGRFPEQKFVVDHLAKPSIKTGEIDNWARCIRAVAKHANVCCKLSGLVTEANWKNWGLADLKPYLDVAFEAFGLDRLMFGSDWPVCLLAGSYAQVKDAIENYTRDLSSGEKEKLFGLNAARFYGLGT